MRALFTRKEFVYAKLREREACHVPAYRSHYAYRAQKVVLDVHHCFEISSNNMCRLYNTAAMAAAEATEATAVVAAVAVSN